MAPLKDITAAPCNSTSNVRFPDAAPEVAESGAADPSQQAGSRKARRRDSTEKARREQWVRNGSRSLGVLVLIAIFAFLWYFSREADVPPIQPGMGIPPT